MIYITNTAFINGTLQADANNNNPLVFYKSVLLPEDISATTFAVDRPAINLWNPDTASVWQGDEVAGSPSVTSTHDIILSNTTASQINYIAIAAHNLQGFTVTVQYSTNGGSTYTNISSARTIIGGEPIVEFFNNNNAGLFRIRIQRTQSGSPAVIPAPIIAHVKMGQALVLQRRMWSGYEPTAIKAKTINNGSDNGQYLGQVIVRRYREPSPIAQQNNTVDFVRDTVTPFLEHCIGIPYYSGSCATTFIFAWRPTKHPADLIYAFPTEIDYPKNQSGGSTGGLMSWGVTVGATV